MEIKIAQKAGFCFGVRRAIKTSVNQLGKAGGKPVYTLGPLVHNPQVIKQLEKEGIKAIEDMTSYPTGHLIIRTHGVSPEVFQEAFSLGYTVVDATCPLVRRIHDIVIELKRDGYPVVVIGHASHPEVQGIIGEVGGDCLVVENREDIENLPCYRKVGVVVQTTALWTKVRGIVAEILEKTHEARIFNTICSATMERQTAAEELANEADVMIVIGGRNSSNTQRLLEICAAVNEHSYLVEEPDELKQEWFKNAEKVGLTAGASTPDYIIEAVYQRIKMINQ